MNKIDTSLARLIMKTRELGVGKCSQVGVRTQTHHPELGKTMGQCTPSMAQCHFFPQERMWKILPMLAISISDVWNHLNKAILKKSGKSNKDKMAE